MNVLELSEQEIGRRQSLQELRDMGINPYLLISKSNSRKTNSVRLSLQDV